MGSGTVIVLSSAAAVKDLMDKQSAITVDRPSNHMADVVTGGLNIGLAKCSAYYAILCDATTIY